MKKMVRKIGLLCLFAILMPVVLLAQQNKIACGQTFARFDGNTQMLPDANISILDAKDSTLVKGGVSDADGRFNVRFVAAKNKMYLLKVSYAGMGVAFRKIDQQADTIDMGHILLKEGVELAEFIVTAPVSDIVQVGDTTVFNAEAFETPEGSYLEELVKRIPGLEYDAVNKTMRYEGKPISSIYVNGEVFFSGNNRMALESLPVELISKIKIYDKRSELEKITGIRSGGENYVLDIQTKGKFSGALLGSAKAGRGNNDKKELELIGNSFKQGGESKSLILNSGNRNMTTRYKNNIQNTVGANFTVKPTKKISVNANLSYRGSHDGNQSTGFTEQYLTSGNRYQLSADESTSKQHGITSYGGVRWEIDEKTFFNFFGNYNFTHTGNTKTNRQAMFDADPLSNLSDPFAHIDNVSDDVKINDIRMRSLSSNDMNNYSFSANLTHKINQKGSSVSLLLQHARNRGENENFMNSSTTYYRLQNDMGNDSILHRIQSQLSPSADRNQSIGLMFTHPITKKFNMQFSYNLGYNIQERDRNTYDIASFIDEETDEVQPGQLPDGYETGYIDSLSNRSDSRTLAHDLALRMRYSDDMWDVNTGLSLRPEWRSIDQKTGLLQVDTATRIMGLQPSIMASWKKDKWVLRFNYNGNTQQPALTDLISLTDNSDPLNITRGNPDLKPAYSQSFHLDVNDNRRNIFASLNWNNTLNSFARTVIYDLQTGGRESYPVNINGNRGGTATLRYQKSIRKFRIFTGTGSSYNRNVSLVNERQSEQPERSTTQSRGVNANLRASYLPKWGSFDLTGDWRFQYSHNSLRQTDNYTRHYTINFNNFANLPGGVQLRTDASYMLRNGTNISKGDDQFIWNAGVTWRFMKKKQAELSAFWSDILSRKKDYNRSITADGFYERRTMQIGSYFIISFRYSFNRTSQK